MCSKFLRGLLKKCLREVASNSIYEAHDFLAVMLEAALTHDFMEGTCRRVSGACDAETLFNRLEGVDYSLLLGLFRQDVLQNVTALRTLSRNRRQVLIADITPEPYYGSRPNEWVHKQIFHKGASGSYQTLVLSVLAWGRREIVGVLPLRREDDKIQLLLQLLDGLKHRLRVDCLLLDRGFDSGWLILELKRRRMRFLMLWRTAEYLRGEFEEMGKTKWKRIRHTVKVDEEGVSFTLVLVKGIRVEGDDKTYWWVFATNMRENQPIKYILQYRKRWGIETIFRVLDGMQIKTKSANITKRLFLLLFTVYLYNSWKQLLPTIRFHITFNEYATHTQKILSELYPNRPLTERQQHVREAIKTTLG
jgi:putative transposase